MSLQETKMVAMKLAFFFFFSLSSLLGAYHARHLHGIQLINLTPEVIQMVTGEEDPQPPPLPPLEGRPSPRGPRPGGETIYGGDNPKSLPSQGQSQTVYEGDNLEGRPSPRRPPPEGQTIYGGDNPQAPFMQRVAPSRGQTTYGGAGVAKKRLADVLALLIPSYDKTLDGQDYLNARPPPQGPGGEGEGAPDVDEGVYHRDNPKVAPTRGETTYGGAELTKKKLADFLALLIPSYDETVYGLDYLNAQPSPKGAGDEGEGVYSQDNPKPSPLVDNSMDQITYDQDDPTTSPSPDLNEGGRQGMYSRVDPIRLMLFKSTSTFDGRRN